MRLFCFPHAGGDVSAFAGWQRALGTAVDVHPVRLPGRDRTGHSPRYADLASLVTALDDDLGPLLREPHLFYGHSMGALVAYRLTRQRLSRGAPAPRRLLVGAFPAPHLPPPLAGLDGLRDAEAVRLLTDCGAIPEVLLDAPEWVRERLALLRADIRICAGAAAGADVSAASGGGGGGRGAGDVPGGAGGDRIAPPLTCPIDVFTGTGDPLVAAGDAAAWSVHTTGGCTVHTVPGGHFFPRESKATFFALLGAVLARSEWREQRRGGRGAEPAWSSGPVATAHATALAYPV